jgi:hypothetical protein
MRQCNDGMRKRVVKRRRCVGYRFSFWRFPSGIVTRLVALGPSEDTELGGGWNSSAQGGDKKR